jgi:tetratricopeptide (TPR) repeat protein
MRLDHRKPRNDEDFEILSLKLLRAHWNCQHLERYSTSGGKQHGVDIIDLSGQDPMRGAQCKLHEEGKKITGDEIRIEVDKAKEFKPPLGLYLILTTSKGNKEAHDTVIAINRDHRSQGLFQVQLMAWNRIEELLDQYTDIRDQYEGGLSASVAARIENKLGNIEVQFAARTANETEDQIHGEIDEARNYLNTGDFQLAKLLLQKIRSRHVGQLSSRHIFRILTNLAAVAIGEDDWKKAGEFYIEAKTLQPNDEMAQVNEALAYQILDESQRAYELALQLKELYPSSDRLFGIIVRNSPKSMSFAEVAAMVPSHLALKGEAAISLGQRAADNRDLETAEKFFRAATMSHPNWSIPWLLLGSVILDAETTRSWKLYGFDQINCDSRRLIEAETSLATALSCARNEQSKRRVLEALLYLSRAKSILRKSEESRQDLEEAYRLAPTDPDVVTFYAQSLGIVGEAKSAVEVIRRVPVNKLPHHGRMMLAMLLLERGGPQDLIECTDICIALAKDPENMKPDFRENLTDVAIESLAKLGRIPEAHSLLDSIPCATISEIGLTTLRAKLCKIDGQQELANSNASKALALVSNASSPHDVRRLAVLLSDLGRHSEALGLWLKIAVVSVLTGDTRKLIQCADRLRRHDLLLEIFSALRTESVIDEDVLEYELQLLETYDIAAAIDIMRQEIARTGNKKLRLRLSYLGIALDRPDLIEKDPTSVPDVQEISPRLGIKAVQVIRASGHPREAVEYAYELLRNHFDDVEAHRAFLTSLAPFEPDPEIKKPDVVAPGAAVCYQEEGTASQTWMIIEESSTYKSRFDEHPPEHFISKQVIGKSIGEKFILAEGVQNRTAQILDIQSKYVYRYQDCMANWQVRFPSSRDVQVVKLGSTVDQSGKEQADISVIKESVDRRYESIKNLEKVYQSENVPLNLIAKQLHTNVFEALRHLAKQSDVTIKCCFGNVEERNEAKKAMRDANTIILDMSAIATLFSLRRLDVLENWPVNFVLSQATDNDLREMIANEARTAVHQSGVFLKTEDGYGFVENEGGSKKAYLEELRKLVQSLETKCKVVTCRALAALEPERRDALIGGFGNHGAEAILLATTPGTVLWTDDHIQALVARNDHGVLRVWTQLVIGERVDSGAIDVELLNDASARLLGFRYFFTAVTPQILRTAAVIADWKVDKWPLNQALEEFEKEYLELAVVMQLAAGFLKLVYIECLPDTQAAVTIRILEHVAKRNRGMAAIRVLRDAVPRIFGLNVLGVSSALETINAWIKSKQQSKMSS